MGTEPWLAFLSWQVEQHNNKEIEDQNSSRVHNNLYCCQQLRPQQQEDPSYMHK